MRITIDTEKKIILVEGKQELVLMLGILSELKYKLEDYYLVSASRTPEIAPEIFKELSNTLDVKEGDYNERTEKEG
jgi:hypothetical protein